MSVPTEDASVRVNASPEAIGLFFAGRGRGADLLRVWILVRFATVIGERERADAITG